MRTIEALAREFPNKTGAELFALQEQDKLDDEKSYQEKNKEKLAWVEDINKNGGFYRGRFGDDQRYYYKVTNVVFYNGAIWFDVENITVFLGTENGVLGVGNFRVEKTFKNYQDASKYSLQHIERVTEKEWGELEAYIRGVEQFWNK